MGIKGREEWPSGRGEGDGLGGGEVPEEAARNDEDRYWEDDTGGRVHLPEAHKGDDLPRRTLCARELDHRGHHGAFTLPQGAARKPKTVRE